MGGRSSSRAEGKHGAMRIQKQANLFLKPSRQNKFFPTCTLGHALCGGCARQLVQGLTEDPRAMGLDGAASVSLGGSDC